MIHFTETVRKERDLSCRNISTGIYRSANESRRARSFVKSRAFAPALAAPRDYNARADAELLLSYAVLLTRDLLAALATPLRARTLTGFANNSSKG